jgi:hypothetical protein
MALNIFQTDSEIDSQIETHIAESVDQKAKGWALNGAWILISVILGYMISTIWDLNGKIYEVAGKQEIQYDIIDELKDKADEAEKRAEQISKEKDLLKKESYQLREAMEKLNHEKNLLSLELQRAKGGKK